MLLALPANAAEMTCEDALQLDAAKEVHWIGIDFREVQMVGLTGFGNPDAIFPGYLREWNDFIGDDPLMFSKIRAGLGARVVWAAGAVAPMNEAVTSDRIVSDRDFAGRSVPRERLAELVSDYDLGQASGIGLVFVMDHMVKSREYGCLYITFFDVETRTVLQVERVCGDAGGWGFRNYWLGPIKDAVAALVRVRRLRQVFIRENRCKRAVRSP